MSWIPSAGKLKVNAESYRQAEAVLEFPGGNVRQPRWYQLRMESGQVGTTRSLETSGIGLVLFATTAFLTTHWCQGTQRVPKPGCGQGGSVKYSSGEKCLR